MYEIYDTTRGSILTHWLRCIIVNRTILINRTIVKGAGYGRNNFEMRHCQGVCFFNNFNWHENGSHSLFT